MEQGLIHPRCRRSIGDSGKKAFGEQLEAPTFLRLHQVVHVGGVESEVFHVQVFADAADVGVRAAVVEIDRCGQCGGVATLKGIRCIMLPDQLDEAFVLGTDQQDVEGKSPEYSIGRANLLYDLIESLRILFQTMDSLGNVEHLQLMFGMPLGNIADVLHGHADRSFRTSV